MSLKLIVLGLAVPLFFSGIEIRTMYLKDRVSVPRDLILPDQNPACPTISLTGPTEAVHPGDPLVFTALVSGNQAGLTYEWSLSAGSIESGQGTPSIMARSSSNMGGQDITASVTIGGIHAGCPASALVTAKISLPVQAVNIFSFTPNDNLTESLYRLAAEVQNNPTTQLVIVAYRKENEKPSIAEQRLVTYKEFLIKRNINVGNIEWISSTTLRNEAKTELYFVPPGAEFPDVGETPLTTITGIVKGSDGKVLQGIKVTARKIGAQDVKYDTLSRSDGTYHMRPIRTGKYNVTATAGSRSQRRTTRDIQPQLTEIVDFVF